ncbi:hypothetical protein D3C78_1056340 [compost metagenome]
MEVNLDTPAHGIPFDDCNGLGQAFHRQACQQQPLQRLDALRRVLLASQDGIDHDLRQAMPDAGRWLQRETGRAQSDLRQAGGTFRARPYLNLDLPQTWRRRHRGPQLVGSTAQQAAILCCAHNPLRPCRRSDVFILDEPLVQITFSVGEIDDLALRELPL